MFLDKPDSKTFDINLIVTLLRNLTDITPPLRGFDKLPADNDITPGADLARIKYYRNYLAHLDDAKVDTTYFNTAWVNISRVGHTGEYYLQLLIIFIAETYIDIRIIITSGVLNYNSDNYCVQLMLVWFL